MIISPATAEPDRQPSFLLALLSSVRQLFFFRSPKNNFFLGPGNRFSGTVEDVDSVLVHGRLHGNVTCRDTVHVYADGAVQGNICAQVVVVEGAVGGDVTVSKRVDINPNARLSGDILSPKVSLAQGAYFQGRIEMPVDRSHVLIRIFKQSRDACQTFCEPQFRPIHISLLLTVILLAVATWLLQSSTSDQPRSGIVSESMVAKAPTLSAPESLAVKPRESQISKKKLPAYIPTKQTASPAGEKVDVYTTENTTETSAVPEEPATALSSKTSITQKDAEEFLQSWKKAMEKSSGPFGDTKSYFLLYAKSFALDSISRSFWQVEKSKLLRKKKWIKVGITVSKIRPSAEISGGVNVFFHQDYASSNYRDVTEKRMLLVREHGIIRIQEEEELRTVRSKKK